MGEISVSINASRCHGYPTFDASPLPWHQDPSYEHSCYDSAPKGDDEGAPEWDAVKVEHCEQKQRNTRLIEEQYRIVSEHCVTSRSAMEHCNFNIIAVLCVKIKYLYA